METKMADEVRKAVIRKTVTRKLNTAKYETMDITAEITQEVEWSNVSELKFATVLGEFSVLNISKIASR